MTFFSCSFGRIFKEYNTAIVGYKVCGATLMKDVKHKTSHKDGKCKTSHTTFFHCGVILHGKIPGLISPIPSKCPVFQELSPESVQAASCFARATAAHQQNGSIEVHIDDFGFQLCDSKQKVCLDGGVLQAERDVQVINMRSEQHSLIKTISPVKFNVYFTDLYVVTGVYTPS